MILLNQLQYLFMNKLIFQLITDLCDLVFKAIVFWTRLLIEDHLTCSIPFRWLCNMPRLWCVILTQLFQPRYRWSSHSWSHNSKFSIDCLTDCSILTWPEFNYNICTGQSINIKGTKLTRLKNNLTIEYLWLFFASTLEQHMSPLPPPPTKLH